MPNRADSPDVVVIGAGLAGTSTACALAQAGTAVVLIDTQAVYPHEFRAEKLGAHQMDQFERLGLGACARAVTTPVDEVCVARFGTLVERERRREYGVAYTDLINRLRHGLPRGATFAVGRVADIALGPDRQTVTLADGRSFTPRLVVLATGLGDVVRRKLGVGKALISKGHSLSLGFDMRAPLRAFPFEALTYYGEGFGSRAAYLTLFPLGHVMRANLFVYRDHHEPWTKAFRADPQTGLRDLMPRLGRLCPDLSIAGAVEMRPVDLVQAEGHLRDGLVLIGDAYLTTCPIPGTGIGKVLTDVDRLCSVHVPSWLATPGMGAGKIGAFYADPVKRRSDATSLRASLYARAVATDGGLAWSVRRGRNFIGRHAVHGFRETRSALWPAPTELAQERRMG